MKLIKFKEDAKYAFVAGRIRVREKELLKKEDFENLLNKEEEKSFLDYLKETSYQKFLEEKVEKILWNAQLENYQFFKNYCLDDWLYYSVLFEYDLHNLKVYLKSEILKKDFSLYFSRFSAIPINILKNLFQIKIENEYLLKIKELIKETISYFEEVKNLTLLDIFVDKRMFTLAYEYAKNSDFLKLYFEEKAFQKNILTTLRMKRKGVYFLEKDFYFFLLPYSFYGFSFYYEILKTDWEKIPLLFKGDYFSIIKEGLMDYQKEGNFILLENLFKKRLLSFANFTKYLIFGGELLCSYYWQKDNEVDNLSKIYYLKIKEKLPKEWIAKFLII
ncbi:MAG: V-type ATPase subunit [candidate division WOR-3 bacterium]|nr:V-type ATPase subunit [candidate division WOR-3 bacterium]